MKNVNFTQAQALEYAISAVDNTDVKEVLTNLLNGLNKKKSGPSKKQTEAAEARKAEAEKVFEYIANNGAVSNADLAEVFGVSGQKMTTYIKELGARVKKENKSFTEDGKRRTRVMYAVNG